MDYAPTSPAASLPRPVGSRLPRPGLTTLLMDGPPRPSPRSRPGFSVKVTVIKFDGSERSHGPAGGWIPSETHLQNSVLVSDREPQPG